jgi:putative transcription factor
MGKQTSYRESVGHRAFVAQTLEKREQKSRYKDISSDEKVLVGNYGAVVRKAREKRGLDHATLASKISEKKSIITSVESGNMKPNEKLIRKLENFFNIKLMEEVEESSSSYKSESKKNLTMGDLINQALEGNK